MELCSCEEYRKAVDDCKIFNIGTLSHLTERLKPPEGHTLRWARRYTKPIFVESKLENAVKEQNFAMWMPYYPGLISQKYVNENKGIYAPF